MENPAAAIPAGIDLEARRRRERLVPASDTLDTRWRLCRIGRAVSSLRNGAGF